jgi:hypothetical protein
MVTGSVASIAYGEPRLTHDIDLVAEFDRARIPELVAAFPPEEFYCPPEEVVVVESRRPQRGHFNLIHHPTGLKADIYTAGENPLHRWALAHRRRIEEAGEPVWLAPPEYVIVRKLEYFREGGSEKHLRDVRGMLAVSKDLIDRPLLEHKLAEAGLQDEWRQVLTEPAN